MSGLLYASLDRDRVSYDEARFDKVVSSAENRIRGRMTTYEDVLRGAAGFISASRIPTPREWQIYVNRLGLLERYPGTEVVSIVRPVADADVGAFTSEERKIVSPEFTVRPFPVAEPAGSPTRQRYVVVCAEPLAVASRALGSDLAVDRQRKAAAEKARDSGIATLTRHTRLARGSSKALQLFVPVYAAGAPVTNVAERQKALVAWVTVIFNADAFFQSALADVKDQIALQAFDDDINPANLMFSSEPKNYASVRPELTTRLTLDGSSWTLAWNRTTLNFPI